MPKRKRELELLDLPCDLVRGVIGSYLPAGDLASARFANSVMNTMVQEPWMLAMQRHVDALVAANRADWLLGDTGFFGNVLERTTRLLHTHHLPRDIFELRHMLSQGEPGRPPQQVRRRGVPGLPPRPLRGRLQRDVGTRYFLERPAGWIVGGNGAPWPRGIGAGVRRDLHPFRNMARRLLDGAAADDLYYVPHRILLDIHEWFRGKPREYLAVAFPYFLETLRRAAAEEATKQTTGTDSELRRLSQLLGYNLNQLSTMCQELFKWHVLDRSRSLWGAQGEGLAALQPTGADDDQDSADLAPEPPPWARRRMG